MKNDAYLFCELCIVGVEARYNPLEKDILTLVATTWKLKPYFQAHPITVLTMVPLRQVIHKLDLTGRMRKWVLELSEYEIDFQPWRIVQAQAIADFVLENTLLTAMEPETKAHELDPKRAWVLYVNSSVGQQHQGVGFVLQSPKNRDFTCALKYAFIVSNNEWEYEALIGGLRMVLALNVEQLIILVIQRWYSGILPDHLRLNKTLWKICSFSQRAPQGI